jgi:dipeptidyl aminopeptidase/acylaminoacyl peptidase
MTHVLLCLALSLANTHQSPSDLFDGMDLFGLSWATDPQIRPDGRSVAYVRNTYDLMTDQPKSSLWQIDVATGAQAPLTEGSTPRWSPDGTRLAYISTSEGGRPQLYVRWINSGTSARITTLPNAPSALSWSPDGNSIAFMLFVPQPGGDLAKSLPKPVGASWAPPLNVVTEVNYRADGSGPLTPGYTHTFVVAADGGAPRQLTFGDFNDKGSIAWSPDGASIYITSNRHDDWRREALDTEIYRVSLSDGQLGPITANQGPNHAPLVSPDGNKLAYLSFEDKLLGYQNMELYVADLDGRHPRSLSQHLDRSIADIQWASDNRSLYVEYVDHGVAEVARIYLNGRVEKIAGGLSSDMFDRPGSGGEFSVADNGSVTFTSGTPLAPSDVSIASHGRTRRLTHLNDELLRNRALAAVTKLNVASSYDRQSIDAWLVTPPHFDPALKYPLILEIHGGPFGSYGPMFATDYQLYAAAGYVVLYTNPRGSTSYGEKFANEIHHAYPGHDYDDLMSAVDAAITKGFIDPDNLFVTGGSGGGVLTAWIIGNTDRFRAAALQKPVVNWTSFALTTDMYTTISRYWFGKTPWEDPESFWKRSPLSLVGNVKTPALIVVGDRDFRTPVGESEQYYQALQLRGVPTALVTVPGASHAGLAARPSQSAAKAATILAWFEKYRKHVQ